jgi:hypothetical protein
VKSGKNSITRMAARSALLAALAISGASACLAHSGTKDEQDACTPDVFRLCSAQIPSEERIVACLNKHLAQLRPACRAVMKGDARNKR